MSEDARFDAPVELMEAYDLLQEALARLREHKAEFCGYDAYEAGRDERRVKEQAVRENPSTSIEYEQTQRAMSRVFDAVDAVGDLRWHYYVTDDEEEKQ